MIEMQETVTFKFKGHHVFYSQNKAGKTTVEYKRRVIPMKEIMHFMNVHVCFANKKTRHYSDNWFSLGYECNFCVKDCPSVERLGGIFFG